MGTFNDPCFFGDFGDREIPEAYGAFVGEIVWNQWGGWMGGVDVP